MVELSIFETPVFSYKNSPIITTISSQSNYKLIPVITDMDIKLNPEDAARHLCIMRNRIGALKALLQDAMTHRDVLERDIESWQAKYDSGRENAQLNMSELESRFENEILEYKKQIKLAEDVLKKKQEERAALMDYLSEAKICEHSLADLKNFGWSSLSQMSLGAYEQNTEMLDEQRDKALTLAALNQKARSQLGEITELLRCTFIDKENLDEKIGESEYHIQNWASMREAQVRKIFKMRTENERLNLLIKQCCITNEPISEYITKNVRAKCQSFMNSGSTEELLNGLVKYKKRQDRTIKILRHKDCRLSRELSILQIGAEYTADQMRYYKNIIQANKDINMAFDPQLARVGVN